MSLRPSFKVSLPVAAMALLIAFAAWPGVRPEPAQANVSSVTAGEDADSDGGTVVITVVAQDDDGNLTITATGGGAATALSLNSCDLPGAETATCSDSDGTATGVTIDTSAVESGVDVTPETLTVLLTLTLDCSSTSVITVTATQDSTSSFDQVVCLTGTVGAVIVEKQSDDNDSFTFDWDTESAADECALFVEGAFVEFDDNGSFDLEDNDEAEFFCEASVDALVVDERDDGEFSEIDDCDEDDTGVDDISGATVVFDPGDLNGGSVRCTWDNFGVEATATAVVSDVTSVTVFASPIISCGGTTAVQVTLRNASGGPAPAGTSVTATSSAGGTFQPSTTLTGNFPFSFATFLYQAPANFNGVTTITVRTNNLVSGSVNVQVTCGATVVPTTTAGPLKPPSAGDGGLLGGNSGGSGFGPYLPSTLAAMIAAVAVALTLGARHWMTAEQPVVAAPEPVRAAQSRGGSGRGFAVLASLALIGLALFLKRRA
jgi:hypothetical protein